MDDDGEAQRTPIDDVESPTATESDGVCLAAMRPMNVPSYGGVVHETVAEYMAFDERAGPSTRRLVALVRAGEMADVDGSGDPMARFVQDELSQYSAFVHRGIDEGEGEDFLFDDEDDDDEGDIDVVGPSTSAAARRGFPRRDNFDDDGNDFDADHFGDAGTGDSEFVLDETQFSGSEEESTPSSKRRRKATTSRTKPGTAASGGRRSVKSETAIDEDGMLGIPPELRGGENPAGHEDDDGETRGTKRARRLPKTLEALLGHANVLHAQGKSKQAVSMLQEVIRQEPRSSEPYRHLADIHRDLEDMQKALQYGLLAAHLDYRTPAGDWADLGDECRRFQRMEEAAACYGRAIRAEPSNWRHYEKRIAILDAIGLRPLAMKTRLLAAQSIDQPTVDFQWFQKMIKQVAEYYTSINDEEKAISALEAFVVRSREYKKSAESQHEILLGLWMARGRYLEAAKSIFALCAGIQASDESGKLVVEVSYSATGYTVSEPFPPIYVAQYSISPEFSSAILIRLIVCFIHLRRADLVADLISILHERELGVELTELLLDVNRAYLAIDQLALAQNFVEKLLAAPNLQNSAQVWFAYAEILALRKSDDASTMSALRRVLSLRPGHVDARIQLSSMQQAMGKHDEALETLRDFDLDACTRLPDERLLLRQAEVLFERQLMDQFVRCVRMLLVPYFYEVHRLGADRVKLRRNRSMAHNASVYMRNAAIETIRGSQWERFVTRLGTAAALHTGEGTMDLSVDQIHDYCLKLFEVLYERRRFMDVLHVCCYAYLQPALAKSTRVRTFEALLLLAAIAAANWPLAFEFLRIHQTQSRNSDVQLSSTRLYNAFAFVFARAQNIRYHRFIMRALPDHVALTFISGNNSLIAGSYRHSLHEYLRLWSRMRDNPLLNMLIGLTFAHIACKKDVKNRHMVALRGLAFMQRYERLRVRCQETMYNFGRLFHQLNILPLAIHFYQQILDETDAPLVAQRDPTTMEESVVRAARYDLKPLAAHNLALIYETSGNLLLARALIVKHCVCSFRSGGMAAVKYLQRGQLLPPLAYVKHMPATSGGGRAPSGIVYIGGYMSNMDGLKAKRLEALARDRDLSFVRFDYTHLGKSVNPGESLSSKTCVSFERWRCDVLTVIDELTEGPQILVGSSMGGWMSLLAAIERPERISAIVTISLAVGFLSRLVHAFTVEERQRAFAGETVLHVDGDSGFSTVLSRELLSESTAFDLRNVTGTLPIRCPVKCLHAFNDPLAPYQDMLKIAEKLESPEVDVLLMASGDHRMEGKMEQIIQAVDSLIPPVASKI